MDRYQDVDPTKQQTGTELFELVHLASGAFPRVTLYFENSILRPDLALLPAAGAILPKMQQTGNKLTVEAAHALGVRWTGRGFVNRLVVRRHSHSRAWRSEFLSARAGYQW